MYTEEPRRSIDWGNLIKKGLLVLVIAAVIFLIIWLFTKNNTNGINVDYNGNNTNSDVTETLENSNAYSENFIDNYRYFHDTAKEYFLISELPTKGNTLKYTLQELINKGLILPFSYGNETCDTEASYATVSNTDGKYTMTITLVCGKEVAKTTEELGCNQLCENGSCENVELEYQYKQAYQTTETIYSCPSGYTKTGSGSNTKCTKTNGTTVNATKNVTYSCPNGYTKSGSGSDTKCTKDKNTVIDATKKTTYSCSEGKLDGTKCIITSTSTINATANDTYSCPSDYTLSGNKCYKNSTTSVAAKYNTTYNCPNGYTKSGTKCTKATSNTKNATKNVTYSCPSGYDKSGSGSNTKCTKKTTKNATANTKYTCSKGELVNTKYCRIYSTSTTYQSYTTYKGKTYNGCTYSGSYTEACSTYSGCTRTYYKYYCNKSSYKDVDATKKTTYSCPSGYTKSGSGKNTKCTKTTTKAATANTTYSCSEGKLDGTKCIITSTSTINATATNNYYCESGYTLNGTKCYKPTQESINATKKTTYSCSNGVLNGSKCTITSTSTKNATEKNAYSCPSGYTKSGTKCKSTSKDSTNAVKSTSYTCESGYTKVGSGSASKCTKGSTQTVEATKSTKTVTKYKYKWSEETSLSGWEKTGKTREVSSK